MSELPLIIEPDELEQHLNDEGLLIIDLCKHAQYVQGHIPGAAFLEYGHITGMNKPTMGLLPDEAQLSHILSTLGMTPETHVVAYDDEGGGKAARLIWTLNAAGHTKTSLLNGGLISWANEGHSLDNEAVHTTPAHYEVSYSNMDVVADTDYILKNLENKNVALLDARSAAEYDGSKKFAERGGHIPGAIHFEWTDGMDRQRNYRLLADDELKSKLNALGLTEDKEIIVYCQTHHRSALSYFMLKQLGYEKVRGYPGSWSEWGNRMDTPVEV
ncbi:MAG: sulfurtransferase [Gammaproteobacteria bacterium]|nr:sulfurtransferase [Gammaproteobacteria bacterium]MCW9004544.1 sulfurtransferase [Gammaproteobacteria bacterium]